VDDSRIATIPNLISALRVLAIPLFLWLLFAAEERFQAAVLLGVLGATDWVDGFIARRFDQVSTLGKVLDPTADRLVLGTGVIAILLDGAVPLWLGALVIVREVAISLAVVGLALAGAPRIDVQWVGKAGTFANFFAFPFFLASASDISWAGAARATAWVFAIPGLLLSYYAAVTYVPLARRALAERAGKVAFDVGEST
jgi:cardiolipin synthase